MKAIKYSILGLVLGTAPFSSSLAQNVEQIHMKSGSIVEGYISEQKPGKHITIQTTKATIVVNSDSLKNKVVKNIPLESLSNDWKEWAEKNKKYKSNNATKQLELCTLEFKNSKYSNVYILEKGSTIKFLDLTPNKYKFAWGEMYRSIKNKRPHNQFSGLKEILVLKNNSKVEGQIIEQIPGKDLKIITEEGEVLTYKFSQIKQIETERLSEKLDLWSQIQLLDKITVKGENSALVGFISSRTLGKELVFESKDGRKRTIQLNEITSYSKIPNREYTAVYDRVLKEGEVLFNGKSAYFVTLEKQGEYLLLGEIVSEQLSVGETACIEAKLKDPNTPITLVKAHLETITRQNGKKKEQIQWPVITYQDLVQSHVTVRRESTPLGNVKISFEVKEVGDYVLHIQGKNEYIVINVVEKKANK